MKKINIISRSIIRKYYKKILFYYYYKILEFKYKLLISKLTNDDPITNELIQNVINAYDDVILDEYYI